MGAVVPAPMTDEWRRTVQQKLLAWFERHRRDLPWRRTRDPYAVLVSEFLLQQTTVEAARRYFEPFLRRFPTVHDLAAAPLDEVLRLWAGLGYYARARHLHATAQRIVREFGGQVPADLKTLQKLPGIGRYTAGAIASIAYGIKVPALDTNAVRVLARLLGWQGDPKSAAFQKALRDIASTLLPDEAPGEFNQAVMDLAALICAPEAPKCGVCPLQTLCAAAATGTPERFPAPSKSQTLTERQEVACVVWRDDRLLVAQRGKGQWWNGLWECPRGERHRDEPVPAAAQRIARERVGLTVAPEQVLTTLQHTVTRYRIVLAVVRCRYLAGEVRPNGYAAARWVTLDEAEQLPSPSPQRELLERLRQEQTGGRQMALF
ncbi:Adenine DNA glycosylase [bacterium HR17]|uniref:Adenine DNA glycosylase n=1 Tax=Candidatus Fervidibacter japonicus TaxID=2035412 RepID=A0A2H5XDP8_9BACT|nr:Adenine DNA glycosylase [bacterium HR17]